MLRGCRRGTDRVLRRSALRRLNLVFVDRHLYSLRITMNIILWVLQIILCIKFLSTSFSHGVQTNNSKMEQSIKKMGSSAPIFHRIFAIIILIGAIGVLLPSIFGLNNLITILSGILLMVIMALSIVFHLRSREQPVLLADLVLCILSAFVAFGRWRLFPL